MAFCARKRIDCHYWCTFVALPASYPTQTAGWFVGKDGWFTEREIIMVNRVLRDDPAKAGMPVCRYL